MKKGTKESIIIKNYDDKIRGEQIIGFNAIPLFRRLIKKIRKSK